MNDTNSLLTELGSPATLLHLTNLRRVNVILGRNGCGKSTLLRQIDEAFQNGHLVGMCKYITPERGGSLTYDGNVESNISNNPSWLPSVRRANRSDNFRQVSVGEFRRLETLVLRKIEQNVKVRKDLEFTFQHTIDQINSLLDYVELDRADATGFGVRTKGAKDYREQMAFLSSGESELISLSVEILSFVYQVNARARDGELSILLLDEPDVHLHPDLQERLMHLIYSAVKDSPVIVIIATHSTSVLGALSVSEDLSVAFMNQMVTSISFRPVSEIMRSVLPIFGAHPLSNLFNRRPILLVEGEDDERIWQQAVRSSQGKIALWPCVVGDVQSLDSYEDEVVSICQAVYDNPVAYSLRDRDDLPYFIDDKAFIRRARLNCRAAENLLLTDDVLHGLDTDWPAMQAAIGKWIVDNPEHKQAANMQVFVMGGHDRRNASVKSLRNLFMERAGSQKPWEVAVGQAIARMVAGKGCDGDDSLREYLGPKVMAMLGRW